MSDYTPTVEERREGAKAIEAALNQCGIAVRYAIAGPSELFDVASVLLKSDFMAAHDAKVRAEQRETDARLAETRLANTPVEARMRQWTTNDSHQTEIPDDA